MMRNVPPVASARLFAQRVVRSALAAGAVVLALTATSGGHSFYPPSCCSGQDCHPLPRPMVREVRAGYLVTLAAGATLLDGFVMPVEMNVVVPFADVKPSEDDDFHICINPELQRLWCFFGPPPGV